MYTLTLTSSETQAFDWVGYRYATGAELRDVLLECLKADEDWGDESGNTIEIPEHVAWRIKDLAEQEDGAWPCFGLELAAKMQAFVDSIV